MSLGIFKRSPDTIYRWIDEGKVFKEVIKIKGGYLFPEKEVERAQKHNRVKSNSKL